MNTNERLTKRGKKKHRARDTAKRGKKKRGKKKHGKKGHRTKGTTVRYYVPEDNHKHFLKSINMGRDEHCSCSSSTWRTQFVVRLCKPCEELFLDTEKLLGFIKATELVEKRWDHVRCLSFQFYKPPNRPFSFEEGSDKKYIVAPLIHSTYFVKRETELDDF